MNLCGRCSAAVGAFVGSELIRKGRRNLSSETKFVLLLTDNVDDFGTIDVNVEE